MPGSQSDIHPKIEQLQGRLLRDLPAWRKLQMLAELNESARQFALAGLRSRHPEADQAELDHRLIGLLHGEELTRKLFGEPNGTS